MTAIEHSDPPVPGSPRTFGGSGQPLMNEKSPACGPDSTGAGTVMFPGPGLRTNTDCDALYVPTGRGSKVSDCGVTIWACAGAVAPAKAASVRARTVSRT